MKRRSASSDDARFLEAHYCLAMTIKEEVRHILRSRGIEVGGYRYTVSARRQQMLAHYGVGLLVDVGANVGQYALAVRAGGYQGAFSRSSQPPLMPCWKGLRLATRCGITSERPSVTQPAFSR